jgi:hypothetical protein
MVKRIGFLAAAAMILVYTVCHGDMAWKSDTPGQLVLKAYIESVNTYLADEGEMTVNRIFEMYPSLAVLGITNHGDEEAPEGVEITVNLLEERIDRLQLRVSDDPERFSVIASCMIRALYGETISAEDALKTPEELAKKAVQSPFNSYQEPVDELSGRIPRFYYAYYPDQYHDGQNWLQMTVIFPMDTAWNGSEMIIGTPDENTISPVEDAAEDYEGYFSRDEYTHLEVFMTATPEPDSAAAEYDFR